MILLSQIGLRAGCSWREDRSFLFRYFFLLGFASFLVRTMARLAGILKAPGKVCPQVGPNVNFVLGTKGS